MFERKTEEGHNGHYDYFLTDAAVAYQKQVSEGLAGDAVDKALYAGHDEDFMKHLERFFLDAVESR